MASRDPVQELLPKMRSAAWNHALQGMTQQPVAKGFREVRLRAKISTRKDTMILTRTNLEMVSGPLP
jgi:hypothetical protein